MLHVRGAAPLHVRAIALMHVRETTPLQEVRGVLAGADRDDLPALRRGWVGEVSGTILAGEVRYVMLVEEERRDTGRGTRGVKSLLLPNSLQQN